MEDHAHVELGAGHDVVVAQRDGVAAAPDGLRVLIQDAGEVRPDPSCSSQGGPGSFKTLSWVAS